jgi:hypothetical protein
MAANTSEELGFVVRAILCDSAAVESNKLYIQGGGWNWVSPPQYPVVMGRIGLAMTIEVPYGATNRPHKLSIRLRSEDGAEYQAPGGDGDESDTAAADARHLRADAGFTLGRPPMLQAGESQILALAMNFDQLEFEHPATWSFVITIDGLEVERLRFRLVGSNPMV